MVRRLAFGKAIIAGAAGALAWEVARVLIWLRNQPLAVAGLALAGLAGARGLLKYMRRRSGTQW